MQRFKPVVFILLTLFFSPGFAMPYWVEVSTALRSESGESQPGRYYQLDLVRLQPLLERAGHENGSGEPVEIMLPMSDGSLRRFSALESPILAPHIAARYPDFKTYKIYGIDDPGASGRLSLNPSGFRGMISHGAGVSYIDSAAGGLYRQYAGKSVMPARSFSCGVKGHDHGHPVGAKDISARLVRRTQGRYQTYRLAVAATAEYVFAVAGGNQNQAFAEVNNAINRVNEIFERDLGVRLILSSGASILYTNPGTDPYTDDVPELLISQNQTNLDQVIGDAGYDIGHVFSTGGGGLAGVGVACESGFKAQGVTGITSPVGDAFYIDYVAHEIGHQFGGDHTFNGTTRSCQGGQREAGTAYEPGSGSTIMAYADICGAESIQDHSDAVFHAGSIQQIDAYTTTGLGATCAGSLDAANSREPVVNAGSDFTVPAFTPFLLSAAGSDANGDSLTYTWDQMDAGTSTTAETLGADLGDNALFRSYLPRAENYRHFPALGTTLQNLYDRSEAFACQSRTLNFRVTARDGKSGVGRDDLRITVDGNSGPFRVTSFGTTQNLVAGQAVTVTWSVGGTDQAPVNCSQVDISLLSFDANKTTYAEILLADNAPNTGSTTLTLRNENTGVARFKVQCSNNVFYDISDADLTITGGASSAATIGKTVFKNTDADPDMLLASAPSECPAPVDSTPTATPSSGGGGGGSSGSGILWWLLGLYLWRRGMRFREYTFRG